MGGLSSVKYIQAIADAKNISMREMYIAYAKQKYLSKAAETFMTVLKEVLANS